MEMYACDTLKYADSRGDQSDGTKGLTVKLTLKVPKNINPQLYTSLFLLQGDIFQFKIWNTTYYCNELVQHLTI